MQVASRWLSLSIRHDCFTWVNRLIAVPMGEPCGAACDRVELDLRPTTSRYDHGDLPLAVNGFLGGIDV
jgi:hypothetical protein